MGDRKVLMKIDQDVICGQLPKFEIGDFDATKRAFAGSHLLEMGQSWLDSPEPGLMKSRVSVGARDDALWLFAEMGDRDIFNPVCTFNQPAFTEGDVFELFLGKTGANPYYEFHVTPDNCCLGLLFPDSKAVVDIRKAGGALSELDRFKVRDEIFRSWVEIKREDQIWRVLLCIPLAPVLGSAPPKGSRIDFSCCRYDYTRGVSTPTLSSTSPYTACDFHRRGEWRTLVI